MVTILSKSVSRAKSSDGMMCSQDYENWHVLVDEEFEEIYIRGKGTIELSGDLVEVYGDTPINMINNTSPVE